MTRYLVQINLAKEKEISDALAELNIPTVAPTVLDYIIVDMPADYAAKIQAIPGVITVREEARRTVLIMPVDKKLATFYSLLSNPLTAPSAFSFSLQETANRWPTFESRKVLGADKAEEESYIGIGVKVAVIDTGHDLFSLQNPFLQGVSSVEGQPVDIDENGHGTHVISTVGGRLIQSPWGSIQGVAPGVTLGVFKALGYGLGAGTNTSVIRAMADAFSWGADVISMSLGGPEEEPATSPECRMAKALTDQGVILVLAAGNDGPEPQTLGTPGNSPDVLTIGAIDREGKIAEFSSRGPGKFDGAVKPDCVAPGVHILSSSAGMIDAMQWMDGPKLAAISGTSMATPHVAGLVALLKQLYAEKGVKLTTGMLKDMLTKYGAWQPKDNVYGWGVLDWAMGKRYLAEVKGVV